LLQRFVHPEPANAPLRIELVANRSQAKRFLKYGAGLFWLVSQEAQKRNLQSSLPIPELSIPFNRLNVWAAVK